MQRVTISSKPLNFQIEICGNISQAEYQWKIIPISNIEKIDNNTLDRLFQSIDIIKKWCVEKGNSFHIKSNIRFKILYYLFNISVI